MSIAGLSGQKELIIKIKADAKEAGKTFEDLKNQFREQAKLLRELSLAGLSSTDGFKKLTQEQKALGTVIQQLNREARGLSPSLTASRYQLAEFYENVTTVTAGLYLFARGFIDVTKATVIQGAQLKVLRENYKGTAEDLELLKKATAGTLTEEQLIPIFNKATEQMKLTTNETARLLAYSEDLADKGIGSLTENFNSLTTAILTGGKGLRTLGIDQKQFKEDLKNTATQLGINTGLIQDGNEEDSISIEKLDAKTQRVLILKTLFDGGYIPSLENVINKEQDSADKLEAVQVKFKEAKTEAGLFILNGIEPLIDKFLGLEGGAKTTAGAIAGFGGSIISVLPLLANLKIAFGSTALAAGGLYGAAAGIGAALGTWLGNNEAIINQIYKIERMFGLTPRKLTIDDYLQNFPKGNIQEQLTYGPEVAPDFYANRERDKSIGDLSKGVNTKKIKKEKEEELFTLDKYLSNLQKEISLTEALLKAHQITGTEADKQLEVYLQQLEAQKNLINVTADNLTADQLRSEVAGNTAKYLQQQLDLLQKINRVQEARVSNVRKAPNRPGVEGLTDDFIKNIYNRPENQSIPNNFNPFNAEQVIRTSEKSSSSRIEPAENPLYDLISDSQNVASNLSSAMSTLGIGTDTFVSQLINGFSSALSLVGNIVSILNSISGGGGGGILGSLLGFGLSFIPGGGAISAVAGAATGGRDNPNTDIFNRLASVIPNRSQNVNVSFGKVKFQLNGETIVGSIDAYSTSQNERRF